ncbi:metallophosphoesterase [Pseudofrankia inefficax]|uniref:Metallophosphoesterase n=2 Tax=Pseudofrankia inefficax (strain DSM 45817 / CECT 9037 / DDB 130130 / EuI1c) TaxID=298654 RepID=E3J7V2_PSEI1|nr:metallophosphoesterase [Pseudofrankia inefficax]
MTPSMPMTRPRPATLLHTADVHLGNGDGGPQGREARAFSRAVDLAIERDVDALLIVGDLFDHGRLPEDLLAWTAKELNRAERPVVLLTGNHDNLNDASIYHRFRVTERCPHVLLLDDPRGSVVEVPGTDVVVWGRALVEHEPRYRPLAGVPDKPAGRWGVVAGHGLVLRQDRRSHHSSPILPSEITAIDWDYVALGHHHAHVVFRDPPRPALYPGATAYSLRGRAGVVVVSFEPGTGVSFTWVALGDD